MRQGRLVATGAMLAFCLFALWQSLLLSLTDRLGPGPGFFPFWLALIGIVLSLALFVSIWREPQAAAQDAPGEEVRILPHGWGAMRCFAIIGLLAAVTVAMEFLGFRLAMLVFNAALVIALGGAAVVAHRRIRAAWQLRRPLRLHHVAGRPPANRPVRDIDTWKPSAICSRASRRR